MPVERLVEHSHVRRHLERTARFAQGSHEPQGSDLYIALLLLQDELQLLRAKLHLEGGGAVRIDVHCLGICRPLRRRRHVRAHRSAS